MAMIKNFLVRQMLKQQLKGVPEDQQEAIFNLIEQNPDFFAEMGKEVQERVQGGMSQIDAVASVIKKHEEKLKKIAGK